MKRPKPKNGKPACADLDAAVTRYALTHPQLGQAKVAAALQAQGVPVSASGVRYLWRKRGLETTLKRLEAIAKSGRRGATLTAGQREIVKRGETRRKFAGTAGARSVKARGENAVAGRELILAAAAELFVEHGYARTSMRQIAERAGLRAGSVYHYFPAKEDLFLAVQKEGFRQITERVDHVLRGSDDPWQRLVLACAEHLRSVVAGDPIARVTGTGLFAIHEVALQRRLKHDRDRYEKFFRKLVGALDLPRGVDRSLFRLALFGALNWGRVWYRPGGREPGAIARKVVAMLRARG